MADDRSRLQATVEDCVDEDHYRPNHEDDLPQPANVHVKRSRGSDLDRQAPAEPPLASGTSDVTASSGYSRHTADTMSTADSMGSTRPKDPTARPKASKEQSTESPRKKAAKPKQKDEHSSSPRTKEARTEKSKSKSKSKPVVVDRRKSPDRSRAAAPPRESQRDREPYPEEQLRKQRRPSHVDTQYHRTHAPDPSHPHHPYNHPSSAYPLQPLYHKGHAAVQPPNGAHHRRSSSVSGRPRPVSYHSADGAHYGQYGRLPAVDHPHGPPPSGSAYANMPVAPPYMPMPAYGQSPHGSYGQPSMARQAPHMDYSRDSAPRDPSWSARGRPTSMYSSPTVAPLSQAVAQPKSSAPGFSARHGMFRGQSAIEDDDDDDDDYSSSEDSLDEAERLRIEQHNLQQQYMAREAPPRQALMPPPATIPNRRGSLHQSNILHTQPLAIEVPYREKKYVNNSDRSRIESVSSRRQSVVSSVRTPITDYSNSSRGSKRPPEYGHPTRRQSTAGRNRHEQGGHSEEESSAGDYDDRPRRPTIRPSTQGRRQTESDVRRHSARIDYDDMAREASKYQLGPEGAELTHTSDTLLRTKTAKGQRPTQLIDQRHASDERSTTSRSSQGRKSTVTRDARGAMTIHVQGDEDFSISLDGDMHGKTINLSNTGDGTAVTIGSSRGEGRSYHGGSERSHRTSERSSRAPEKVSRSRVDSLKGGLRESAHSRLTTSRNGRTRRDDGYL